MGTLTEKTSPPEVGAQQRREGECPSLSLEPSGRAGERGLMQEL